MNAPTPTPTLSIAEDRHAVDTIEAFARQASDLGREAAVIAGDIADLSSLAQQQRDTFAEVGRDVTLMVRANDSIDGASEQADVAVRDLRASLGQALKDARVLAQAVEQVHIGITAVTEALRGVSTVARNIGGIALQTRIIAFNANIEAARAGQAGRGFAVVAESIKDLAQRAQESSQQITTTVSELEERIKALSSEAGGESGASSAVEAASQVFDTRVPELERSIGAMRGQARENRQTCQSLLGSIETLAQEVDASQRQLDRSQSSARQLLELSEDLIEITAESGYQTIDTPFIARVTAVAEQIGQRFQAALDAGELSADELFDVHYQPVAGTDPQQYLTRYLRFADRVLPEFQEPVLQLSPLVSFCAAIDINGYLPTHNAKFSQPQGNDPRWNAANCRNRRIFNDRTGLAAARNQRPFLLQSYRRDMGGGEYVVMKDLSAPIRVGNRHWGALRLGYRFD